MKKIGLIGWLILSTITALFAQTNDSIHDSVRSIISTSMMAQDTIKNQILTKADKPSVLKIERVEVSHLISISNIVWTIVFLIVGYFSIKVITRILEITAEKSTQYRITIKSFIPIVKIIGWIIVIFLIIAGIFQPPVATVLAFSASVGVAVGFASQDILKNMFGGIMILFDRPFKSGDKIEVGNYYGEVVGIGLRSTRIVTPDDNLVSIPNSTIMNSSLSNANAGESNCQVVAEVYLPIQTDTYLVRAIATQAAQVSKYVYLNKPITVVFGNEFKDRSPILKMKLKAYVLDIRDEFKFKSEMTEIVIKKMIEEKIIEPQNFNSI